jgi:5-methylcytosine-specific restriction protein A
VHLFEVFEQNRYVYAGRVTLAAPMETEQQPDDAGNLRKVFVFPLKLVEANQPPAPTFEQVERIRQERQARLKPLAGNRSQADARSRPANTNGMKRPPNM